jgi:hypothetical protein
MSGTAQYASIPRNSFTTIQTANTLRDGTGTLGIVATAPSTAGNGKRIDRIQIQAGGTTTTNVVRLFITEGRVGAAIASLTSVGSTVTVTTSVAHGMTTGDLVTVQSCFPFNYNVAGVATTVLTATTFSFTAPTTPAVTTASTVGSYSTTPAAPVSRLWRELLIPATTPSTSIAAYSVTLSTAAGADIGYMPLVLEAGNSLRASTNNAEIYYITTGTAGDFA